LHPVDDARALFWKLGHLIHPAIVMVLLVAASGESALYLARSIGTAYWTQGTGNTSLAYEPRADS
jgi:hypothetical protein